MEGSNEFVDKTPLESIRASKKQKWISKLSHHQVDPLQIVTKKDDVC
jgi:hypothetical protein